MYKNKGRMYTHRGIIYQHRSIIYRHSGRINIHRDRIYKHRGIWYKHRGIWYKHRGTKRIQSKIHSIKAQRHKEDKPRRNRGSILSISRSSVEQVLWLLQLISHLFIILPTESMISWHRSECWTTETRCAVLYTKFKIQ